MTNEQTALSLSDRFTNSVVSAYQDIAKGMIVGMNEKQLIANYFVQIDKTLKSSKNNLNWNMVKMPELALTVAHMSRLGLDMSLPNMISFLPFKDKNNRLDMVPVIGAKGYEYLATKYGLKSPKNFIVELVYSTDTFQVIKKDSRNAQDSYVFEINNPFARGEIVGGFGYLEFPNSTENKILVMSKADILKYRPSYYDKNFWTGENEKKMYEKTIAKQLLKKITLDPDKVQTVGSSFATIDKAELDLSSNYAHQEIDNNANQGDIIDITDDWDEAEINTETEVEQDEQADKQVVENPVEIVEEKQPSSKTSKPKKPWLERPGLDIPQQDSLF